MTKKSNIVELVSVLGKVKPCEFTHGSCSKLHTPLRGEQQATFNERLRGNKGMVHERYLSNGSRI